MTRQMTPVARPAIRVPGHFGEWIQGRLGPEGPVVLVTLACPALGVMAAGEGPGIDRLFPPRAVAGFARALGLGPVAWPGLGCDMPMGAGAGASTACLVASARAMGARAEPEALARACLAVEGATDPLMYPAPDAMLWASREARVIEDLPLPPPCEVVGGFWGASARTDPEDHDFPDIADLVPFWRAAVARGDLAAVAGIATESARRCSALRGPVDPMAALARDLGALGHTRAYTGTARALIFAPGKVPDGAGAALAEAGLTGVLRFATGGAA
ncbi:uncharacterized protein involved in propanediol utilization [Roseovarius sp. MBR-78]|uniref:propanediol utilization protein n=1 Tax=Roseovarius sp. MBR-78 TaxID=3156460 RepID=UPI00339255D6